MIRSIVLHQIPMTHIAAMEKWYWRDHAPEIVRRYGPWMARHESWLPVDAPADARALGWFNWRLTDGWWREMPLAGPRGAMAFTLPPHWPTVATCFIAAQPDHDWKGAEIQPHEKSVLRWVQLWRYPEGVSRAAGDAWLTGSLVPELCRNPAVFRAFSHAAVTPGGGLPGVWPPDSLAPMKATLQTGYDRVVEIWTESFDDWRAALQMPLTPPPWATRGDFPFVAPGQDFVCSFVLERPNDEFLRDARGTV